MLRVQSPDRVLGDKSKLSEPGKSHSKLAMKAVTLNICSRITECSIHTITSSSSGSICSYSIARWIPASSHWRRAPAASLAELRRATRRNKMRKETSMSRPSPLRCWRQSVVVNVMHLNLHSFVSNSVSIQASE